jgi:hypothetical protein
MTRHKWRELSEPVMADPVRRAEIEEIGRAMDLVIALAKMCESRSQTPLDGATASSSTELTPPSITDADSRFIATLREGVEELGGRLEVVAVFPDMTVRQLG